jgi:hypothetical protein
MASPRNSGATERLPASLFNIYLSYKRGTLQVIDWLKNYDKDVPTMPNKAPSSRDKDMGLTSMTIRQLLGRAQKAASESVAPPEEIQSTFRRVLLHRRMMVRYYESLPNASDDTQESTDRHKAFNELLAEAYNALCKSKERQRRGPRTLSSPNPSSRNYTCPNNFDTLADLIETEETFEVSAADIWADATLNSSEKTSAIAEDPIETTIATHAYVVELQSAMDTVKSI